MSHKLELIDLNEANCNLLSKKVYKELLRCGWLKDGEAQDYKVPLIIENVVFDYLWHEVNSYEP